MLLFSQRLRTWRIGSLQTGRVIATVSEPLISPHNLSIRALWCRVPHVSFEQLLLLDDIRTREGEMILVNDASALVDPEDVVRMHELIKLNYQLVGKPVYQGKQRLGTVKNYSFESDSWYIEKLYITPTWLLRWHADELIIGRAQIIKLTPKAIYLEDNRSSTSEKIDAALSRRSPVDPATAGTDA